MNRSPRTMPSIGGDVMSIANRIRELAVRLEKEQQSLKIAQQRLAKLKEIERKEQDINDQKRRQWLQAVNARNEVELEIFAVKDKVAACQQSIEKYTQEREELEEKLVAVQEESKHLVESFYAPQQLKMDLYLRALEGVVYTRRDKMQKRMDRLAAIRAETKELKAKEKADRKEGKQLQKDIAALTQEKKGGGDEDVSAVFTHNQNLIKERAALRKTLKEAQKLNNEVNDEYLELEEKRIHEATGRK